MSDPVKDLIDHDAHEAFINKLHTWGKMAEAADIAHANLLASLELYHGILRKTEAANATMFNELITKYAALAAWRNYAQHQETCGVCADYVGDCDDGSALQRLAFRADAAPSTPATEGK